MPLPSPRHLEKSEIQKHGGGKQTSQLVSWERCANEKECGKKMCSGVVSQDHDGLECHHA